MTQAIKETIILTASYYNRTLSKPLLNMYLEDLEDLPPAAILEAYRAWRRNAKNTQFPLPAQIRNMIQPEVDDDSLAKDAASRILEAVVKFGWNNPTEAKAYVGDLAWAVVVRFGGWDYVSRNMGTANLNIGTFQAQARDIAKTQIVFAKAGRLNEAPSLPEPVNKPQLNQVTRLLNSVKTTGSVGEEK